MNWTSTLVQVAALGAVVALGCSGHLDNLAALLVGAIVGAHAVRHALPVKP